MPARLEDDVLNEALAAYYQASGNRSEAARLVGVARQTYNDRLDRAAAQFGVRLGKVADGAIEARGPETKPLPKHGRVHRYLLTSIQNNTHLHPGFESLLALRDYYGAELMIGTYSYQLNTYGPKAVKRGSEQEVESEIWYAPRAEPFIVDRSIEIAPGLVWCGEQNIIPTAKQPLSGYEDYNGRKSNIIPHAKVAMQSVASMADEATKFNYTTGTVTQRNYLQMRAGIMAEQKHSYCALLVEVDSSGDWYVRQLHIDSDNRIMDVGPEGTSGIIAKPDGTVEETYVTSGIYWGDVHAAELDGWVKDLGWGKGGMLDALKPKSQFLGDVFSMRSRSHHEIFDFHATYAKHVAGQDTVEGEMRQTAEFINGAARDWCSTVIVPSNHDRHLDRWLNEADFRRDPLNAKYFCFLQYHKLDAIDRQDNKFNILEFALSLAGLEKGPLFLGLDESYLVEGIENGLHGDLGANGSRGTTKGFTRLGRAINKGHDHTAAICDNVYAAGSCATRFSYTKGPGSHSVSHIVTYKNGKRAIITMYANKWRA